MMEQEREDHIKNLQQKVRESSATLKETVEWHIHNFMSSDTRIFFSECDFQIELATYLRVATPYIIHAEYTLQMPTDLNSALEIATEVVENDGAEENAEKTESANRKAHIDLVVEDKDKNEFLPIELKYRTLPSKDYKDSILGSEEERNLVNARVIGETSYDIWKDVCRIVYLKNKYGETVKGGLVLLLSNKSDYWEDVHKDKAHRQFRVHDERRVKNDEALSWCDNSASEKSRPNIGKIGADVEAKWYDANKVKGIDPQFRYLILDPQ